MATKQIVKPAKVKKKQWFQLVAPKIFNEAVIGETPVWSPDELLGKSVKVNLMTLTNDIKQQSINLRLDVSSIDNDVGRAEVRSYELSGSAIKRLVRRGTNRIDDSLLLKCKNNASVRLKPMVLTRGHTTSSVQKVLRKSIKSLLAKSVAKLEPHELVSAVVARRLQNELRAALKKTYPIKVVEIKKFEFIKTS